MFSLYIPAVVLMVVLTLQDLKKPKRKKKRRKKHQGGCKQTKDRQFTRAPKASNKWANKDFIVGVGIFGLLPTLVLGKIGDSLPRSSDRYTYTVSVPNMYHSLGRGVADFEGSSREGTSRRMGASDASSARC